MSYEQIKTFYAKDMGSAKGWCLANVAKGFHIYPSPRPNASARVDMEVNQKKGTFHSGTNGIPSNCSVPVYVKSSSQYGHIVVYDKGQYYTDGKKYKPSTSDILGWGEWCNGFQIVKSVSSPSGFLPNKGYWGTGDNDYRVGKLCKWYADNFYGYFCKNSAQAHAQLDGDLFGKYCQKWTKEFQKRTGLAPDGYVGKLTYAKLKQYGFKG